MEGAYPAMPPYPQGGYPAQGVDPRTGYPYPPTPYGFDAYGQPQPWPTKMPSNVLAAQVISFLFGGLGILLTLVVGAAVGAEAAGGVTFGFLFAMIMAAFAFACGRGGNSTRVTLIVLGYIEMVIGLGGMASQNPPGLLGFGASLAVVILLSKNSAKAWFNRPRF